jgi:hypothetical protein
MLIPTGDNSIPLMHIPSENINYCSNCKKEENKIVVCGHCGYKYVEQNATVLDIFIVVTIIIFLFWALGTLLFWFADTGYSLLEVLQKQLCWALTLKLW